MKLIKPKGKHLNNYYITNAKNIKCYHPVTRVKTERRIIPHLVKRYDLVARCETRYNLTKKMERNSCTSTNLTIQCNTSKKGLVHIFKLPCQNYNW